MLIPRIVRGNADKAFAIVRNLHSAALGDGECVRWLLSSDTPPTGYTRLPGVDVRQNEVAAGLTVAGILSVPGPTGSTIAQGDFCLCQIYGNHDNVKTTVAALAAGATINGDNATGVVAGATADDPSSRVGICITLGAANRAGCIIQKM